MLRRMLGGRGKCEHEQEGENDEKEDTPGQVYHRVVGAGGWSSATRDFYRNSQNLYFPTKDAWLMMTPGSGQP